VTESNKLPDPIDLDSASAIESPDPGIKPDSKVKRPRRRFSKTRRALAIAVVFALVVRISLPLWLPPLIDGFAKSAGLVVRYDDLNLSLLGASVELWGLEVDLLEPVEGEGARVLDLDYLAADLDSSALLLGEAILHRAEVGNLAIFLRRRADGTWQLAEAFVGETTLAEELASADLDPPSAAADPVDPKTSVDPEPVPFNLNLPLAIERLTVTSLAVHLDDRLRKEVRRLDFELALSGLGNPEEGAAQLFIEASVPGFLAALRVEGQIYESAKDLAEGESSLGLDLTVKVLGMDPKALDPWGGELGIAGLAHDVEAHFAVSILAETSAGASKLGISFALDEARWEADGDLVLGLEGATGELLMANAQGANEQAVQLRKMELFGLRAEAERLENGKFGALGFGQVAKVAQPEEPESDDVPDATKSASNTMQIAGLSTRDFGLRFVDRLQGTSLLLMLDSLELGAMQIGGDVKVPTDLEARLSAPGLFDEAVLAGSVQIGDASIASLDLDLDNLRLGKLKPYLTQAGIESEMTSAQFHGHLEASIAATDGALRVALTDVLLTDIEPASMEVAASEQPKDEASQSPSPIEEIGPERHTLFALDRVSVRDLITGDAGNLSIGEVAIRGTTLDATRLPDGSLRAAGLHFINKPVRAQVAAVTPKATEPTTDPNAAIAPASDLSQGPIYEIDLFTLSETHVSFEDQISAIPELWAPSRVDLRLSDLVLGDLAAKHRAELRLDLEMPGLIDALVLDLEAHLEGGGIDATLNVKATGIGFDRLAPYLAPLGLEGEVDQGQLAGQLNVRLEQGADESLVAASLKSWSYLDDEGAELLGLDLLDLKELRLPNSATGAIELGPVLMDGLRLGAQRDAKGELRLLGLHLIDKPVAKATGPRGIPVASQATKPDSAVEAAPSRPIASAGLSARNMQITWRDQAVTPKVDTELAASLEVSPFAVGPGDASRSISATLQASVSGLVEQLALTLDANLSESAPRAAGEFKLGGMRGEAISAYLPDSIEATFVDGQVSVPFQVEAGLAVAGEQPGKMSLNVNVGPMVIADGGEQLAHLGQVTLEASAISPAGISVEKLALTGIAAAVQKLPDGSMVLPGFVLHPALATGVDLGAAEAASSGSQSGDAPGTASSGAPNPMVNAAPAAAALQTPSYFIAQPTFSLGQLEIQADSLVYHDLSGPPAAPLELKFSLRNETPWHRDLRAEAQQEEEAETAELAELDTAPLVLNFTGSALPLASGIRAKLSLQPFAVDPALALSWLVDGISGPGLLEFLPEFASTIDASELLDGEFAGNIEAILDVRRRGPLHLDFGAGFGGQFELRDLALRSEHDGRVLLGLDALVADLATMSPRTGRTHFRSIELERPIGFVHREDLGTRILGLVIKDATAEASTAEAPTSEAPRESAPVPGSTQPAPELRIDRIFVTGADLEYRDDSVSPPMALPLTDLDIIVSDFTSRAFEEKRAVRFEVFAKSGSVELQERHEGDNLLLGLMGAAADLVTLEDDDFVVERRPAFSALDGSGNLTFFPSTSGWAQLELAGIELPNFRGIVRDSGVDIGDGLVDLTVDLRFLGEKGLSVETKVVATHLSLTEPPGGPISTYLKLPAPLDTVLFLLRNEAGAQEVAVRFNLEDDGIKGLGPAIAKTLGLIIGDAIASSPMRLVGGVLDMTGMFDAEPVELPEEVFGVTFLAGSADAQGAAALLAEIEPVLKALRADPTVSLDLLHAFGKGDLERIGLLANPGAATCIELSSALRSERDHVRVERDTIAAELRTAYALGDRETIDAHLWKLRNLDDDLGRIEDTLDGILEFLRPGAERRAMRRTRASALLIAEQRLTLVREAIASLPIESIGARLRVRRARFTEPAYEGGGRVFVVPSRVN
jgi:hypothetical protein